MYQGYDSRKRICWKIFENVFFFNYNVWKINGCGDIFRALSKIYDETFKSALPGLTQIMATESPLKMMKNAFYFILKAIFVLKIFKFFPCFFGHIETRKAWLKKYG